MKRVNAWICAPQTSDHEPASVIPDKKRKSVTTESSLDQMFVELLSPVTIFLHVVDCGTIVSELVNEFRM